MPGTVKSELLPDADRLHKCDGQEKVCEIQHLPLDKSHFITVLIEKTLENLSVLSFYIGLNRTKVCYEDGVDALNGLFPFLRYLLKLRINTGFPALFLQVFV